MGESHHIGFGSVCFSGTRFLTLFLGLQVLLHRLQKMGHLTLIAWGTLAAHIAAFSAIDFFGMLQSITFFSNSIPTSLLAVGITVASFWVLFALGEKLRLQMK